MMYRDQPRHAAYEALTGLMWKDHPLGRPIIGFPETLKGMNHKAFRDFTRIRYGARNTVVALAGKLDHDESVARVAEALKDIPASPRLAACKPVTEDTRQARSIFESRDIEQTHLAMGIRVFGYSDERRHGLRVLSAILGENMSSRLFQIVREKHGLAYSVHSSINLYADSGALLISAGLDRTRTIKALELIVKELRRLKEQAVSAAELNRAKDYVIGQLRLSLESTTQQMMWVGDNLISKNRFVPPEETIANIEAVTVADLQKLAKTLIRKSRASLSIVSPKFSAADQQRMRSALNDL